MRPLAWVLLIGTGWLAGCAVLPTPMDERARPGHTARAGDEHVVVRGDTLFSIAWRYGWDYRQLAARNGIREPYTIYPGQRIRLDAGRGRGPAPAGPQAVDRRPASPVTAGRTTAAASTPPAVSSAEGAQRRTLSSYGGPVPVVEYPAGGAAGSRSQQGAYGGGVTPGPIPRASSTPASAPPTAASAEVEVPSSGRSLSPGITMTPLPTATEPAPSAGGSPEASPPRSGPSTSPSSPAVAAGSTAPPRPRDTAAPAPRASVEPPRGSAPARPPAQGQTVVAPPSAGAVAFRWPHNGTLLSRFSAQGAGKKSITLGGRDGDPVVAAEAGVVVYRGNGLTGYGNLLIIKHSERWLSAYGHLDSMDVKEGERVSQGQRIGAMGSSGAARTQLLFEIRRDGTPVDPVTLLPRR